MIKNLFNFIMFAFVLFFVLIISEYYFSETNSNLLKKNRNGQTFMNYDKFLEIPVLKNNTDNVIHFKTGYDDTDEKKFKRSFWDVFKK